MQKSKRHCKIIKNIDTGKIVLRERTGKNVKVKKSYFKVCLLTICILLGQGIAVSAAKTPVAAHGRLSVKGVDLIDAKGKKFQLRGISSHGINWDVGAPYVNKASFKICQSMITYIPRSVAYFTPLRTCFFRFSLFPPAQ